MSRVIKGAIYNDEPKFVAVPTMVVSANEEGAQAEEELMTPEAQEHMLAEIRHKEAKASQLLKDAQIQAEIVRQEAKAEADKLMLDTQDKVASLQEEAKKQGYEQGLAEGRETGAQQIREEQHQILVDANAGAERLLKEAQTACQDYITSAENTIAEMVLKIANKILPRHFIDVPQMILPLVQEAIQKVKDQPKVVVKVAPEAYELVMMAQSELQAQLEGSGQLEVQSDGSLKAGDCLVESPNGVVDAGVATQLRLVEQAVRNVMK